MKRFVLLMLLLPLFHSVVGQFTLTTCSGSTFSFSVTSEPVGTQYSWTAPTGPATFTGGVAQPNTQLVVTGNLSNPNNEIVTATYTITSTTNNVYTLDVRVIPFPIANPVTDPDPVCTNEYTIIIPLSGPKPNTEFFWSYFTTFIGLPAFNTIPVSAIPAFPAVNNTNVMQSANISIIPTIMGCAGNPVVFKIRVKPAPNITDNPNLSFCHGTTTPLINLTSNMPGSTINWFNDNPSIGLSTFGVGSIAPFAAENIGVVATTANIQVSGFSNGCNGPTETFTIAVIPIPQMQPVASASICGGLSPTVQFSAPLYPGTNFNWTNSNPTNGLPSSGIGQINSYIANNFSNVPVTSEFTVTPSFLGCNGTPFTFTLEVKATPKVDNISSFSNCANTLINRINFTGSAIDGTEYQWSHNLPAIGLLTTSGIGNIDAFTATNAGNIPISSNFTVRPFSNTCYGPSISFSIRVNPVPKITQVADQSNCEYLTTLPVSFTSDVANTIFNWTNNNSAIGIPNSGSGNIGVFTYANPTPQDITGVITVTPISNTCSGSSMSYSYTAKAAPDMQQPTFQIKCNGVITDPINFIPTTMAGATFSWVRTNITIGAVPLSGTGNIDAFTSNNGGQSIPVQSVFTVIPFSNSCNGLAKTFTITINPTPSVTVSPSGPIILCSGFTTSIGFSGSPVANTQYQWTNDNTLIGIGSSGSGSWIPFTGTNTSAAPITALVLVTPVSNSCQGTPVQFSICVKPTPTLNALSPVTNCSGSVSSPITFTGSLLGGTQYNWVHTTAIIGLTPLTGTDNIPSFTTTNIFNVPISSQFTVTPFSNGCSGTSRSFSYTVNPTPTINLISDRVICTGVFNNIALTGSLVANTTYNWLNDNASIGIGLSGSGNAIAFTAANISNVPITGRFTVTPVSNSCNGTPATFSITVNPVVTVSTITSQIRCNGTLTSDIIFTGSSVANTTYSWTQSGNQIGLTPLSGTGNILAFTTNAISNVPLVSNFTVTPMSNSCAGVSRTFSILVNPIPTIDAISSATYCSGTNTSILFTGSLVPGTQYQWTNNNLSIGLPVSGTGSINSFTLTNNSNIPISANILVTPVSNACFGTSTSFSIIVQPAVSVDPIPDQVRCNGTITNNIIFTGSNVANTVYNWTQSNNLIGLAPLSGSGNIGAFTTNTGGTNVPIVSVFTVTPISNACSGAARTFSILVNPIPNVNPNTNISYCNGTAAVLLFTGSVVAGTQYQWTNSRTSIGLAASGNTASNPFLASNNSNIPVTASILVTPFSNGCTGTPNSFTITINPTPVINGVIDQAVCNNTQVQAISFTGSGISATSYQWVRTNIPIGSIALSGTGDITSFTGINNGNVPLTSLFTVTPISNTCSGNSIIFSVTVNPTPTIDPIASINNCAGILSGNIPFSGSTMVNTQFTWTNNNVATGLAANGSGNINSFTLTNSSNVPITSNITVTPFSNSCPGTPAQFQIIVKPRPDILAVSSTEVCNGTPIPTIAFSSSAAITGTIYNWTNNNINTGLGSFSGTGSIVAFTGTNAGNVPIVSSIQVSATANGCSSLVNTFTIRVNPTPSITAIGNQLVCGNTTLSLPAFSGSSVPGTVYQWNNTNPSIGIAATGTGTIAPFTVLNNFLVPISASILITPLSNSCAGASTQFTIVVNPTPNVIQIADQTLCKGAPVTAINFSGTSIANTVYSWTNSNPAVGLASSTGTGNIASFTSINNSNIPITTLITVTPISNSCSGVPMQFSIRVNPIPSVAPIADQNLCGTQPITAINFVPNPNIGFVAVPGTQYNWTNSNSDIGLPLTGAGSIASFSATNLFNIPITTLITVTPVSNTCFGTSISFSIQIRPSPIVDLLNDQALCTNIRTQAINFTGSTIPNTLYNWTNSNPAIGLASTTGSGNIPSFTATNLSNGPISSLITVTPFSNACSGTPMVIKITVNPIPAVNSIANQTVCGNSLVGPIQFTGSPLAGTLYQWTNNNTNIGLPTSGVGSIQAFTISNYNNVPVTAQFTVTPVSNTCIGISQSFSISVIPSPIVNPVISQALCTNLITMPIQFGGSTVLGTEYRWTQNNPAIGLAGLTGTGDINSFTAANNSNIPITSIFTVRAYSNTCYGLPETFSITVNPIPAVNQMPDMVLCGNNNSGPINFSGSPLAGTVYQWTNNNSAIGLAVSGTGNISSFSASNTYNTTISALITVTPISNTCSGIPKQFSIVIKPTPGIASITNQVLCTQLPSAPVIFTGATIQGTEYQWRHDNPAIGLATLSGVAMVPSFTTTNLSNASISSKFTVTPFSNGCSGNPAIFYITVDPIPRLDPISNQVVCGLRNTMAVNFSGSPIAGTVFNWTNSNPLIGLPATGSGNINSFTTNNNSTLPISAQITVTPFSNTCLGSPVSFNILVKPTPGIDTIPSKILCANTTIHPINLIGSVIEGTRYDWTNDNPFIGLASSGTGNISSFLVTNSYNIPITAHVSATAFSNGCISDPITFTISVSPIPSIYGLTDLVVCATQPVNEITFSGSTMAGTIYQWANDNTLTGLNENGNGNIPAFTAINSSNIPITSQIRVTPISNTCAGIPANMKITVKPSPNIDTLANKVFCRNTITQPILFTGSRITNTVYNWIQTNNSVGLTPISGNGNIPSFSTQNNANIPIRSTITVTPFTNGCNGIPTSFDISVNPVPSVNPVGDITICGNGQITPIIFTGSNVPGTEYRWTNDNTATGISATGIGNIDFFSATNNFTVPIVSRITVTAFSNNCSGNSVSFTVTIKPTPKVEQITNQIICANTLTQPILFTGSVVPGTQYQWTTSNVGIGISSLSGIGNINSFTATTTSAVPNTAQFTVVPFSNNCYGNPITFSITVNPIPSVNSLPDIIQCGALSTNPIVFQGSSVPGTIYQWTNNNTSIGMGSSGTGNIAAFSAVNNANLPVSALITVTPFSNGCSGPSKQFNITIKSTPSVDTVANQIICSGKNTKAVIFTGSKISNTKYNWVSANALTGIPATFGSDSIPSFATTNISNVPINNTITVTPFSNGCSGIPVTFNYIVHPIPNINLVGNQIICGSALSSPIIFTGSLVENTIYEWKNSNPAIGLPASGIGAIPSFTPANSINIPVSTIITATPLSNSCFGTSISFSIVIKPIPVLDSITNQSICNTVNTSAVIFSSSISNTSYSWTNNNTSLGLPTLSGNGNIASFKAINAGVTQGTMNFMVTPLANGCLGASKSFTITVNPTPTLSSTLAPTGICNNAAFSYTIESATPGTSFLWQRLANPNINGNTTSGGFTQFIYETLQTTNTVNSAAVYAISLTANGCNNAQTVSVSISPSPVLSTITNIPAVCSGSILQYTAQTATPNTLISWNRGATAGITNAPATGINTISEILTNNTLSSVKVDYKITLTTAGCSNSQTVTATILPTPIVTTQNFSICSGGMVDFLPANVADSTKLFWESPVILPSGSISGAQNNILPKSGFSQRLTNNTSQIAYALYTVRTTANNCLGNVFSITVQVLPSPVINSITLTPVCSGSPIVYQPSGVSPDTRYTWTLAEQIPRNSLSGTSSGNNQLAFSQTLFALNTVRDTAIYTVQANSPNCIGTTFTVTVHIKPTPIVKNIADTVCSGERFTFIPDSIPTGTEIIWTIPQIFPLGSVIGTTPQNTPVMAFTQTPVNIGNQISNLNYQVNAVYDNCLSQPFTINLKVTRPIPNITPYNSSTCSGVPINITPKNMPSGISYSWDIPINNNGRILGGTGSLGEQTNILLELLNRSLQTDTIQYKIYPHLDNCIGQPFAVNILVTPLPQASASGFGYVCQNVNDTLNIQFSGKPPFSFKYADNGKLGVRNNISKNPYTLILPPAGNGVTERVVKVYQISDSICTNYNDTIQVYQEVKRLPSGKLISLHGNYICNGIPDTLVVQSADSVGYTWKLNGNIIPGQTTDSLKFATLPGIYQVTLTDGFGCSDTTTNSIRLIISKPPVIKFKQDIRCINSLITFTNQTDSLISGPLTWKWDFGNGFTSTNYHASTTYQIPGSYHVIISAQQQNCGAFPPTILDSVIDISKPIDLVDSLNVKAYKNQNTIISARYLPNYKYEWRTLTGTTAGLKNPNTYETIFNYGESVRYIIKLTSPEGCVTPDSMWVRVYNQDVIDIFVPKTFTPNNDGKNDKIFPYLTPGIKVFNYFRIYNRFGNILFETRDYSMGWDGRYKGVDQPMGVYFWEVNYVDANGKKDAKYGQFLLSR